tara:strand:- start:329 stop:589 length:261 start_codon:yes stop_codon:yes gene_type:complete
MNKKAIVNQLGEYFTKKGKILELNEYNKELDVPMRGQMVKRVFNSWSRMMTMVKNHYPDIGVVKKVVTPKVTPKKSTTKKVKKNVK